jgi:hypothetical protein
MKSMSKTSKGGKHAPFSQVFGKSAGRSKKKSVGMIAAPNIGKVSNGVKPGPTKSGGKRIF